MTNKIEISRDALKDAADILQREGYQVFSGELRAILVAPVVDENAHLPHMVESLSGFLSRGSSEPPADRAAPVVERQEPVGRVSYIGSGFVRVRTTECLAMEQPLYASPPPPVVVLPDLSELREYHAKAISNLKSYADDEGLRDSDVKHYTKRADFHAAMVELIDKVKELNQ